jgi:hypothetical protein
MVERCEPGPEDSASANLAVGQGVEGLGDQRQTQRDQKSETESQGATDGPANLNSAIPEPANLNESAHHEPAAGSPAITNESQVDGQYVATHQYNNNTHNLNQTLYVTEILKLSHETQTFLDPTQKLPGQMDVQPFALDEHQHLVEALEEHRLIILSSFDPKISFAAAYSLVSHLRFKSYDHRLLVVEKQNDRSDININLFSRPEYSGKDQIVLIEISQAGEFLDSLRTKSIGRPAGLREVLAQKNLGLVCTASCEVLGLAADATDSKAFPYFLYALPFLSHMLMQRYGKERARELEDVLLDQRKRKLWDDCSETEDFFKEVRSHLVTPGQLEQEIERREALFRGLSSDESVERLKSVRPEALFANGDSLYGAVLFTATYFRDLTPDDFETIVCLVLDGETREVEKQSHSSNDKGEVQVRKEMVPKLLVDIWHEEPDRILGACSIEAIQNADSLRVLAFSKGYLRRDMRAYLESKHPLFLSRCLRKVRKKDILLQEDVSDTLVDNIVRLWADGAEDLDDLFTRFFLKISVLPKSEAFRSLLYDRLCHLIREVLQRESLRGTVHRFLDLFFRTRRHDTALDIVLELARRLRFAPEFETFFWIKRLLDEGGEDIWDSTYEELFSLARESGSRIYEMLEALKAWLPEAEEMGYSPSSRHALSFLPDYCSVTANGLSDKLYGEWPSHYGLFSALPSDPQLARAKLDLLASWLTHPKLKSIVHREGWNPEDFLAAFIGDLLELWILILEGVAQPTKAESRRLSDVLIETLASHMERSQRVLVVRYWQWRQQAYYLHVKDLPVGERDTRKKFLARRKKLLDIKQRFVDCGAFLHKSARETGK